MILLLKSLCSNVPFSCSFKKKRFLRNICFQQSYLIFILFLPNLSIGQTLTVKGVVRDKLTKQPIPAVNVSFPGLPGGTVSDVNGVFEMATRKDVKTIRFSAIGFKAQEHSLDRVAKHHLEVDLEETTQQLEGVSIHVAKRPRYRNRDNEAVDLIRKVIAHKAENIGSTEDGIAFRQYEKLNLAISIPKALAPKSILLRKFPFLAKTADTVRIPGKALVPIFMQEKINQHIRAQHTETDQIQFIDGRESRVDQYFDEDGIDEYLNRLYQPVDIYHHDIGLGAQRILSPIASLAPEFYKYFIIDTLKQHPVPVVHMLVSPRNKQDILFMGELYIPLDGKYAIQKAELYINKEINLNWVQDLKIGLSYQETENGKYQLAESTMAMDLGLFKGKYSIFGVKTVVNSDYVTGNAVAAMKIPSLSEKAKTPEAVFNRPIALSSMEQNTYYNIDSLKQSPKFKNMMGFTSFVLSGYAKAGPVELGPIGSFYSFNPVEGRRFRLSARTNDDFSKKVMLEGHLAYGLRDEQWKYAMGLTYSFNSSGVYQFPVSTLTLRHSYETQIPGQDLNFIEDDNILLSFKRGVNDKWLYNRKWSVEYFKETKEHLSLRLGYRNQELAPAGGLIFQRGEKLLNDIRLSEFTTELRWAPHEQFYQGKRFRRPIRNGYPIFTLRASAGFKGLLDGDYNYQNLSLNIYKRFYLAPFGHSDVIVEGGKVFGKVPFPLLAIHRANQTYSYQPQSYNLMNFMEFMSDRYASIHIDHSFNGLILNKVPLVKKLQLREVASLKVLYGGISDKNMAQHDDDLFRFPKDKHQQQSSFGLGNVPYVEGSVGLSNIFKILRVDYVRRFTYLEHSHAPKWGIRARIHVDF
jgi:hypothetical protein